MYAHLKTNIANLLSDQTRSNFATERHIADVMLE